MKIDSIWKHAKGRTYRVVGFCKIKNTETRAWEEGVMYHQLPLKKAGENEVYVRSKEDFEQRFKQQQEVRPEGDGERPGLRVH